MLLTRFTKAFKTEELTFLFEEEKFVHQMIARKLIAFLWQKLKLLIADSALELIGSQDSVILTIDVGNRYCTRFTKQQFDQ